MFESNWNDSILIGENVLENKKSKILVADDDRYVRDTISNILKAFGHTVISVADGTEVVQAINESFDAVILDINMPQLDGFTTLEILNKLNLEIPVLFLTGDGSMDYAVRAINLGAYDFINKPIDDIDLFNVKICRAVEKRMYVLNEHRYKADLENDVQEKTRQLEEQNKLLVKYSTNLETAALQIMLSLQNAMEEKDQNTAGHSRRVTDYSVALGKALGISKKELLVLRRAARFHDIGKLVIDLSSIRKPGKLTREEWLLMKKHPIVGANIIQPLGFLKREQGIIRQHHERIDGKGYPDGLKGDQLDPLTKILTVADSYDTMISGREYSKKFTPKETMSELQRCAGTQFDDAIIRVLTENIDVFLDIPRNQAEQYDENIA